MASRLVYDVHPVMVRTLYISQPIMVRAPLFVRWGGWFRLARCIPGGKFTDIPHVKPSDSGYYSKEHAGPFLPLPA